jgi:hypothetical protein
MAGFQIDDAIMQEVVSTAILKAMTDESRSSLVQQAIASLLSPEDTNSRGYSSDKRSRLQKMFEGAVRDVALVEVKKALEEDERVRTTIREMVAKGLEHALENDTDLVSNLATAIGEAFAKRSNY